MSLPAAGPAPPARSSALAPLGLACVFAASFGWVEPTNFGGFDEWLLLDLGARGVVDSPHANRPFGFLWHLPAAATFPGSFAGYYWWYAGYLLAGGLVGFWLVRRLAPGEPSLAFLAAAFALTWAPADLARLSTVQMSVNAGSALAAWLAATLFVESWIRRSPPLLLLGGTLGLVALLSHEGTLGLLLLTPVLVCARERPERRFRGWVVAWEALVLALLARLAAQVLGASDEASYQASVLGLDLAPRHVIARLGEQFFLHLTPLVTSPPRLLLLPQAAFAAVVFAAAFAVAARSDRPGSPWLRLAGLGLLLAGACYLPFALSDKIQGANRTEILAAPAIGLTLAALVSGIARLAPSQRRLLQALTGVYVVALGTALGAWMQGAWRQMSHYERQRDTLRQLVRLAPDLEAHTLVVLLEEGPSRRWVASFAFRHAVAYLYERRAIGVAYGAFDPLYSVSLEPEHVRVAPLPVLREPWDEPVTRHRYAELVVVVLDAQGKLSVAREWPAALPALAPGAVYEPLPRIRPGPPRKRWAVLD